MIDEYGCTALHNATIAAYKGNIEKLLELMQPDTLSWRDWKQSPVYSALLGEHPLATMKSLLAKQEVKEAPFWKNGILQDILKDPPFAQISQTHRDEVDYKSPVPGPNTKRIVQAAEATVVAFFKAKGESGRIRRNRPIKEVVYDQGPTEVVGTARKNLLDMTKRGSMRFNSNLYAKENLKLIWVHLPSTNDLLTAIMSHERYRTRDYYKVRSFFRDSWVEVPDKESRSRMMRPRSVIRPKEKSADVQSKEEEATESTTLTETDKDEDGSRGSEATESETKLEDSKTEDQRIYNDWDSKPDQLPKKPHEFVPASAIYMPYLSYSTHCRHWDSRLLSHDWDLKQRHDHYEELLDTYKGKDEQQHGSPTLDEWYYQFAQEDNEAINDQSCRNESQIVSKYLRENERAGDMGIEREPNQWTVVRVNQVWIWAISTKWVITTTASPLGGSPDLLVEEILNSLSKHGEYGGSGAQPVTASEVVPAIIDHSSARTREDPTMASLSPLDKPFLTISTELQIHSDGHDISAAIVDYVKLSNAVTVDAEWS
ncbi:ankyrin [Fusarium mexicanum]|uniref:Ankyrin n=1 Tax=Fusarium mexicanum TaxID=751941 RepID=A0A8H5I2V1_9HYPO|nr:ankyrin [Fusarium mexicanum]